MSVVRPEALDADRGPEGSVLVIDDDDTARRFLVRALRKAGLEVIEAANGADGLARIEHTPPSVVLLDSQMPGLDGLDVLAKLRDEPKTATLPVILVTGHGEIEDRVAGLEAGADDFLTKPVHPDELVARVRAQIRGQGAWLETLEQRWQERSEVVDALGRIGPSAGARDTAAAICRELSHLPGAEFVAVLAFEGEGDVVPLATHNLPPSSFAPGSPLPSRQARTLRARAVAGPWTGTAEDSFALGNGRRGLAREGSACFAPMVSGGELLGLLVLGGDAGTREGPTAGPGGRLATVIDLAAVAAALLAPLRVGRVPSDRRRAALEHVIETGAFWPVFQPIVALTDQTVVGFEALTRFTDGADPAARFGDAARLGLGLGLSLEITPLRAAVAFGETLPAGTWLSVNASAPLLVHEAEVTRLLKSVERPMVVELTEREQVDDYDALRIALHGLAPGARIAVDDAGAGYASLRHILALEPDFIKLDTSWVRDLDHDDARQALVAGLGYFAQRTHCALVAEGVEREGEADALRRLGVAFGQGYLFGTPEPIDHWT